MYHVTRTDRVHIGLHIILKAPSIIDVVMIIYIYMYTHDITSHYPEAALSSRKYQMTYLITLLNHIYYFIYYVQRRFINREYTHF